MIRFINDMRISVIAVLRTLFIVFVCICIMSSCIVEDRRMVSDSDSFRDVEIGFDAAISGAGTGIDAKATP